MASCGPTTPSSHAANLTLRDDWFGDDISGYLLLAVPNLGDDNHNGFADFFESSQPVNNVATTGSYSLNGLGSGSLQATWSRGAGSSLGSCNLKFKPNSFYTWLTFNLAFQLLEYSGPLTYAPGTSSVTGRLDLVLADVPDLLLGGSVAFVKSSTDPFNHLTLQPGSWTNTYQQTLVYTNAEFSRDPRWPTNYFGYVVFDDDANPDTAFPFDVWMLSIDDSRDSNHNGIPDFSDNPVGPLPPRRPELALTTVAAGLRLTIRGDVGHVHQVQGTDALDPSSWATVWSEALVSDPQTIDLPTPTAGARFWRVTAQ